MLSTELVFHTNLILYIKHNVTLFYVLIQYVNH